MRSVHLETEISRHRFWDKVNINLTGCWQWIGAADHRGYGYFGGRLNGVSIRGAHRFSYTDCVGAIPDGYVIDHLCRNPSCVRPDHLEAVTERTNLLRGMGPTWTNAAKTHCENGHRFEEENTYVCRNGWRSCRTCSNSRQTVQREAEIYIRGVENVRRLTVLIGEALAS